MCLHLPALCENEFSRTITTCWICILATDYLVTVVVLKQLLSKAADNNHFSLSLHISTVEVSPTLLHVKVSLSASILKMFSSKDEVLLIRGNTLDKKKKCEWASGGKSLNGYTYNGIYL